MRPFLLLIALLLVPGAASADSNFTRINAPGKYAVGLHIIEQYDFSRGYLGNADLYTGKPIRGERARPIQTLIWYPAQKGTGRAMSAGDYLRLGGTSDYFPHSAAERSRLETGYVDLETGGLTPDRIKAELSASMLARRDGTEHSGKYPVIIYAPSYQAPAFENADLCEYLASQGYIVIASPSTGPTPEGMKDTLEGVEAQVGDIQFLIGYAHTLAQADTDHLAVMGYSWGGLANVMAAAKDTRIAALVSLDGSVRYYPDVVDQSRYLTPERVSVPLLYIAATPKQVEELTADVNKDRSFLNKIKYADLYRVTLAPYVHANFSVMLGQRFLSDGAYGNYNKDELSVANGWLETYALRFLDGYLKGDATGRAFLDVPAAQTGAPPHLLTVYKTKGQGQPATRAAFAEELGQKGFEQATTVYRAFQQRNPSFVLNDDDLISWGYQLLGNGNTELATYIFRFNTEIHPESWNAFDSLGEAYAKNNKKQLAIDAYEMSLKLNPHNINAVGRLKALGVSP